MENNDQATDHLFNMVMSLAMGDLDNAKTAHTEYYRVRAEEKLNEDHDKLLTDEGIEDFLKTLHKRASKEHKSKEFCEELSKFTKIEVNSPKEFNKVVDHFSKDKKRADKFIHHVEKVLKLEKDDPAKDIKGEGEDE